MKNTDQGFVYVATGPGYLEEARRAVQSLRHFHPDDPICLITDIPMPDSAPFDQVIVCQDVERKPIDKLLAIHCPYERVVFLDTDTQVAGDLSPLFALLDRFDLALHQDVHRGWNYDMPDVPLSFSEFNTGVIVFRKTAIVEEFFRLWRTIYDELHVRLGLVNDQPAFRHALYHSNLRVAPLPSEFHFLGNFSNYVMWKARLIHGRGDLDRIQQLVNQRPGCRAYVPEVGVIPTFQGRRDWIRTTLYITWRMLRLVFRPPADSAAANPGQWWLDEKRPLP